MGNKKHLSMNKINFWGKPTKVSLQFYFYFYQKQNWRIMYKSRSYGYFMNNFSASLLFGGLSLPVYIHGCESGIFDDY